MLDIFKKRRSHRSYLDKKVESTKIKEILKAAMTAPSAYHRYPWEFIVVQTQALKNKLSLATSYSSFAAESSVVMVVCANMNKAYRWIEDCSIVAEHIYLEATNQGLGTCWIQIRGMETAEGKDSEEHLMQVLKIPSHIRILCLMPIAYPAKKLSGHDESLYQGEKVHRELW